MLKLIKVGLVAVVMAMGAASAWAGPAEDYKRGNEFYGADNYREAAKLYRKAANQGHARAQLSLGLAYQRGLGVPQDYAAALKWYRKAADQGYVYAQFHLGYIYDEGNGVPQDYREAAKWYRKAAGRGYADAQWALGNMYYNGDGVPQAYMMAHIWFNLAATNGHDLGADYRDKVAERMTPAQIAAAQSRASACFNSNYRDCE